MVGLVSAAVAAGTAHPGTATAILDEAPPAFASGEEKMTRENARRVSAYAHAAADPVAFAVLEPAETKRAALVVAVEAVAQTTRVEHIVRARAALSKRRQRRKDERHEASCEDDSSEDSSSRGEDERRSEDYSSDDSWS